MTLDPVGRRGAGIADRFRRLDAGTILATILVTGLALRILIAGILLPLSGFTIDIGDFTAWGNRLASVGPGGFYEEGYFSDYPPGYLYVLWLLGTIGELLAPVVGVNATAGLVKLPGILSDVGVAWLLFVICRRWGAHLTDRTRFAVGPETLGLAAATVYLFNPGVIFDSAVWGQIDSVGTLVLLATVYALARGWTEAASLGAVVAMLVKFQFAFLIPIVAIVGLRRHLFGRSSDPAHDGRRDPVRVLTSLATGFVAVTLLILPFGMLIYAPLEGGDPSGFLGILPEADPEASLIGKFVQAAGTYTGLTVNAFNLWRNPWSGLGDTLHWGDDTTTAFVLAGAAVTWQQVGTVLFAIVALVAFWVVARRDDLRGVLLASLVLAIAFFVLPTRVHERYLFPALALAAPLLLAGRPWPWIYAGLSLSFFANIYWVYTEDWSFAQRLINPGVNGEPMAQDPLLSATLLTDPGIWLLSALSVLLLLVVLWRAVRAALTRPQPQPVVEEPRAAAAARAPRQAPRASANSSASSLEPSGWLAANPADAYLREPPRRLNRRDALLLLGLVVFALVFRLWRLDVPRGQHFDEVYHARSAAEFLSSWQHGWDRDVYEWTHPMLAKYLIAAGIVVADPNQVVDRRSLDSTTPALAVAPQRESAGRERSVAFRLAGPETVVASDAGSGEELARWEAGGPAATLAFDPEGPRLLVGRADTGTVETYELASLVASPDGRAPPRGDDIDAGLDAVIGMVAPESSTDPLLIRGPDGFAVVDRSTGEARSVEGSFGGIGLVHAAGEDGRDSVAVTDLERNAVVFVDLETLEVPAGNDGTVAVDAALGGPLVTRGGGEDQQVLALTGPLPATDEHPATSGGIAAIDADDQRLIGEVPLPGSGTLIGHQRVADLVYVAGAGEDGSSELWVLEPHVERRNGGTIGLAAFDTTELPGTPLAMAFDVATTSQDDDHGRLLVATAGEGGSGTLVEVDAGSNAFAWRLAGAVFGAILVGLVYLLAATMFARQRIAVLAAGFVAIDGMTYVMSRIAMNDIFVTVFIAAAYLVFWQVWSGRWARSAWWALPLTGVLIGLAAATKWVGFYALAGLLVLALARSSLGRLVLVALAALAAVVGGIGAPWPFLVVMLGILAVALAITWIRPIRFDPGEAMIAIPATTLVLTGVALAFVIGYGQVEGSDPSGAVEMVFSILARGAEAGWPAFLMLGVAGVLLAWRAVRSLRDPASDRRWHQPGEMGGFAWAWLGASLVVVPLTVYALSYVPYLQLGHAFAIADTGPGYGWSLDELHRQMFGYHFNLTAGHASSSPWWSWPLALKPTWFFNGTYDGDQIAVIYNGGNPILLWAGIPALVACAVLAWKRRSAALVLIVAAFAFQYVPWIRIERATFAYHYLTALVFAMVAVAYVVDELLRRPAWRDLAIGYLALVVAVGVLLFPLGAALPMPDWYINAARALPPWNYGFQFPDPPQGERADLVAFDAAKVVLGGIAAIAATAFAVAGRSWWERRNPGAPLPESVAEGG